MEATGWVPFASAVAGAVFGALASLGGSVWVQRREAVRAARIRMFDELLPMLDRLRHGSAVYLLVSPRTDILTALAALRRSALIVGRREQWLVGEVQRRVDELVDVALGVDTEGNVRIPVEEVVPSAEHEQALTKAIDGLESHLVRKLL